MIILGIAFAVPKLIAFFEKSDKTKRASRRPDHEKERKDFRDREEAIRLEEERKANIEKAKQQEAEDGSIEAKSNIGGKHGIHSTKIGEFRNKIDKKMAENEKKKADAAAAKQAKIEHDRAMGARSDAQKWYDPDGSKMGV